MKVLGIMGSPRIKGNTDLLLDEALKGVRSESVEVEKLVVDKLDIKPCKEYYNCFQDGTCVIHDEMDSIYPRLLAADVVILASPIFFYAMPAQLKALIDRCQATWARRHILKTMPESNRKGAFIAVGATKGEKLFDGLILTAKYFFDAIGVSYAEELLIRGVDQRGEIKDHPAALEDAFQLGRRLIARE